MNQWEIQKAIYQELFGSVPLAAAGVAIYDNVPQKTNFPYIAIGDDTGLPWDDDTSRGTEATITLHIFTRNPGRKQCKDIMKIVYNTLHQAELDIEGMDTVLVNWEYAETIEDPDQITRHGVQRFRIIAEEAIS